MHTVKKSYDIEPWLPTSGIENKIFKETKWRVIFPFENLLAIRALKLWGNSWPFKEQILQNGNLDAKRSNIWRWKFIKTSKMMVNERHGFKTIWI